MLRSYIRAFAPAGLLALYRRRKKLAQKKALEKKRELGEVISEVDLIEDLQKAGIQAGDTLLVHAALSKIGYVENGAQTVVDAILKVIGPNGNLLMPVSPNAGLQLDYIRQLDTYDVKKTPSALGAISEFFRNLPAVMHSAHPTEPVAALGPDAAFFVQDHFSRATPYDEYSPFYRITERAGKILYLGVTFDNAGTSLHTLEDAVPDFKFPVYYDEKFTVKVKFADGSIKTMETNVHNPEQSARRKCDGLIPLFKKAGVLSDCRIGNAPSLLVDSKASLLYMINAYREHGITMYTPEGNK